MTTKEYNLACKRWLKANRIRKGTELLCISVPTKENWRYDCGPGWQKYVGHTWRYVGWSESGDDGIHILVRPLTFSAPFDEDPHHFPFFILCRKATR